MNADQAQAADRRMIAKAAALTRWARTADTKAALAPARQGFRTKFEREAAELGITDPAQALLFVERSLRAHMTNLARKSAKARRKPASAKNVPPRLGASDVDGAAVSDSPQPPQANGSDAAAASERAA